MRTRTRWMGALLGAVSALALAAACAGSRASGPPGAAGAGATHPAVDTGLDTCSGCHGRVTPQVAALWKDSRHGMSLVGCVVCHGSTGADFRVRPASDGCGGCHASEVASLQGAPQDCFGCHPAHALRASQQTSPHGATAKGARP